jgi:hypothetical protein
MHLKSYSNDSKSRNIELDRVFEKLKQKKGKNSVTFKRKSLKSKFRGISTFILLILRINRILKMKKL